ncbi:MAG: hypothetical protein WKG32_17165 [Gemmatimonadaceae bacterium]
MTSRSRTRSVARVALGLAVAASALSGLANPAPAAAQRSGRGFLFGEPLGSIALRGGFSRATAGSDVFSFATDELTLGRGDFSGISLGGELSFRVAPRVDVLVGAAYAGSSAASEIRKWTDQDDRPIEQTTSFRRVPVTASLKLYLADRGRSVGRLAWIPSRYAPYVGVGGGLMWYRFRQDGDFVDVNTLAVFPDRFDSRGWTPTAHGMAGVDFSFSPRLALTGEGRYGWAKARLSEDFSGFDRIDLSGFSATLGFLVRL